MAASRMDLQSCCLLLVLLFTVALAINREKVGMMMMMMVMVVMMVMVMVMIMVMIIIRFHLLESQVWTWGDSRKSGFRFSKHFFPFYVRFLK